MNLARSRIQLENGRGDDAERSLGANEEVLEVVPGVVLAKRAQSVPDRAVGRDDLQTEHSVAGISIAEHVDAAGVGRQVAAHLAGAFGGQAQRKQAIHLGCRLLGHRQRATCFDDHGVVHGIDPTNSVHAVHADQQVATFGPRYLPTDEPGVSPLRDEADLFLSAQANDGRDLVGVRWFEQERRLAHEAVAPFRKVRRQLVGIGGKASRANHGFQPIEQCGRCEFGHASKLARARGRDLADGSVTEQPSIVIRDAVLYSLTDFHPPCAATARP